MIRSVRILVVLGSLLWMSVEVSAQQELTVHLAGLRIVGPGYGLNGTELQAFHEQSGTTLVLAVQASGNRKIVEVNDSECSLTEFGDDRGHNMLDGIHWGGFPKISEDGRHALVEVTSKDRPSAKASQVRAKGRIHLRVASSVSTARIDNLKLTLGAQANVRQEIMEVMKVQKENDGLTLVLQMSRNFRDNMKEIRFLSSKGDPIHVSGRGSFTFGNATQMEYTLETTSKLKTLKMEVDLWQELETLDLPFAFESGVGL